MTSCAINARLPMDTPALGSRSRTWITPNSSAVELDQRWISKQREFVGERRQWLAIHESADVASDAVVAQSAHVWHVSQICAGAVIGEDVIVGRGAYVGPGVRIGAGSKIQNYALIYGPAELSDGVFVGPAVVFTNDRHPRAIDPDGVQRGKSDWTPVGVTVLRGAAIGARIPTGRTIPSTRPWTFPESSPRSTFGPERLTVDAPPTRPQTSSLPYSIRSFAATARSRSPPGDWDQLLLTSLTSHSLKKFTQS